LLTIVCDKFPLKSHT